MGSRSAASAAVSLALGALFALAPAVARANCGSAFCSINTNWETQGEWTEPGFRLNLRYEYVKQDQPRQGTKNVGPQGEPGGHDEIETINHNVFVGLDYSFNQHWGVGVQAPFIKRKHAHIHNPTEEEAAAGAEPELEQWNFSGIGDTRILGRYQFDFGAITAGTRFGVKLPTGSHDETNSAGELAERSLQPGTGSTDLVAGAYLNGSVPSNKKIGWFAQAQWQHAVATKDEFRPGDEITFDAGARYAFTDSLHALAQVNARYKRHDSGANAEPADSGGKYLFFSPGVSFSVNRDLQLYAFVQFPLYQNVNGIQLTADTGFVIGASYRF